MSSHRIKEWILDENSWEDYWENSNLTGFVFTTSSGTKASWNLTLCRTWSKTGRSRPCPTTSSSSTSSSRSLNNSQRTVWVEETSEQGLVYVCAYICVCVCDGIEDASFSSCGPPFCLRTSRAWKEARLNGAEAQTLDGDVIWHFSKQPKRV